MGWGKTRPIHAKFFRFKCPARSADAVAICTLDRPNRLRTSTAYADIRIDRPSGSQMKLEKQTGLAPSAAVRGAAIGRIIHWAAVALVFALLAIAVAGDIDPHGAGNRAFLWHSTLGLVLYLLTAFRVLWWIVYRPAVATRGTAVKGKGIPQALQITFYGLLIVLPISGWFLAMEEGMHSSLLGLLALPQWYHEGVVQHTAGSADTPVTTLLMRTHIALAVLLVAVIIGHLLTARRS
jgi:cytochrome b561